MGILTGKRIAASKLFLTTTNHSYLSLNNHWYVSRWNLSPTENWTRTRTLPPMIDIWLWRYWHFSCLTKRYFVTNRLIIITKSSQLPDWSAISRTSARQWTSSVFQIKSLTKSIICNQSFERFIHILKPPQTDELRCMNSVWINKSTHTPKSYNTRSDTSRHMINLGILILNS